MEEEPLICGVAESSLESTFDCSDWDWDWDGGCITNRTQIAHAVIVPAIVNTCSMNARSVVRRMPPYEGSLFGLRYPKKPPFFLTIELVDDVLSGAEDIVAGELEVVVAVGSGTGRLAASLSAGCRSGRAATGDGTLSVSPCSSSLNPISPLFVGKGPASGRDSSARVEPDEDTAVDDEAVDAILGQKVKENKRLAPGKSLELFD